MGRERDMLKKIISGCQTGADIAGIDAAIHNNFSYGGWVPKGRKTEAGPLSDSYVVQEMPGEGYMQRTRQNVIDSNGTVIFTHGRLSDGSDLTRKYAIKQNKPWLHIDLAATDADGSVEQVKAFIVGNSIEILNVAGKSESRDPKIYNAAYGVINSVLST